MSIKVYVLCDSRTGELIGRKAWTKRSGAHKAIAAKIEDLNRLQDTGWKADDYSVWELDVVDE